MDGQIKFWIAENAWGLVRDPETNQEFHIHINDVVDRIPLERNEWVSFDVSPRKGKGQSAINVTLIACPPRYLLRGTVIRYVENQGFGFIRYGRAQSVFFHIKDFLKVEDAESVVPVVGAKVSFSLGQKFNQQIAAQIWIEQWPAEPTFEEQFSAAEELSLDVPEPVVAPQSFALSPENKNVPMIELIRRRREGRAKWN